MIEIVRYSGEWCAPCRMMDPVFEELSKELPDIKVTKIDIDDNPDEIKKNNIRTIPTIFIYKDGMLLERHSGAISKNALKTKIEKYG